MIKDTVAILTNFMEFNPGYSLTGIVQDQCKMLQDNGHPVKLFVNSQYAMSDRDKFQFSHNVSSEKPNVDLYRTIPFSHLKDYTSVEDLSAEHIQIVEQTKNFIIENLDGVRWVFTHDFMFTGWFLPYGLGVMKAAQSLPNVKFFHWIHSTPSTMRDWWNFDIWGDNHKIIFPNSTECVGVAEQYRTLPNNVKCIHHIKDLRTWNDFCRDSNDFIKEYPQTLSADIVKVYPISSDRFGAKGLNIVFRIFSRFKEFGRSVFLIIANQWATGRERREDINKYIKYAEDCGLVKGKDFVFTSEWNGGKYNTGITKRFLRDLSSCSNMFIFPTREESFGLVGLEIPLSTAAITVTNRSLKMMDEVHGNFTNSYNFGSFDQNFCASDPEQYYKDISVLIYNSLRLNKTVLHRTYLRQHYNWDYLYRNEYLPIMLGESSEI